MGKSLYRKRITLGTVWVIIFFALTYAFGEDTVRFQGYLMNLNLEKRMMLVNEGLLVWDEKTVTNNDVGSPIPIEKFKPDSWVYIEGERSKGKKCIVIRKIFLLPKYIDNKERNRYLFMQ